jgi:hypothetical protein
LARAFVDLASGEVERATANAVANLRDANARGDAYIGVLSTELLAACLAGTDAAAARAHLAAADRTRPAIGARRWPLQPFRHAAQRSLGDVVQ